VLFKRGKFSPNPEEIIFPRGNRGVYPTKEWVREPPKFEVKIPGGKTLLGKNSGFPKFRVPPTIYSPRGGKRNLG